MGKPWPGASERPSLWVMWSGTNPPSQKHSMHQQRCSYNDHTVNLATLKASCSDLNASSAYKQTCQVHLRCQNPIACKSTAIFSVGMIL